MDRAQREAIGAIVDFKYAKLRKPRSVRKRIEFCAQQYISLGGPMMALAIAQISAASAPTFWFSTTTRFCPKSLALKPLDG
jgi:hypothetical protein